MDLLFFLIFPSSAFSFQLGTFLVITLGHSPHLPLEENADLLVVLYSLLFHLVITMNLGFTQSHKQKKEEGESRRTNQESWGSLITFELDLIASSIGSKTWKFRLCCWVLTRVVGDKFVPISCCMESGMGNCCR